MSTTPPNLFSIEDAPGSGFEIVDSQQPAQQQLPAQPPGIVAGGKKALGSDLWNFVKGIPQVALGAMPGVGVLQEALPKSVQNVIGYTPTLDQIKSMAAEDAARKAAGRSLPYRAIAPVGELATGLNVGGMEQSAAQGDVGGVLGHAAAPLAAMALTAGAAKAGAAVLPKTPIGIRTRAAQAFQGVEAQVGDQAINHQPVLNTAYKAMEMSAKGFQLPKPVADFVEWAKSVQAAKAPFRFADARDFYTALGESIPWDQYGGKGGRMYTQVMKMRAQLGDALKSTANQGGVGPEYNQALKDYRTASNITKGAKTVGSALTLGPMGKAVGLSGGDFMQWLARKGVNAGSLNPPGVPPPPIPEGLEAINAMRQGGEAMRRSNADFIQDIIRRQGLPVDPKIADVEAQLKQRAAAFQQQREALGPLGLQSQQPTVTSSADIPPSTSYYERYGKVAEPPAPGNTPESVAQHMNAWDMAKARLGPNATISQIAQEAERIRKP